MLRRLEHTTSAHGSDSSAAVRPRWHFSWLNLLIAAFAVIGMVLVLYPTAAGWVTQRNQSNVVIDQSQSNSELAKSAVDEALDLARQYNAALESGALFSAGANIAAGTGETDLSAVDPESYWELLNNEPTGMMARVQIPSISLDLPIYHGTSDETLLRGIGHLQGTSLPVGGVGTRSVITGHRGLANAAMFTYLDQVKPGDMITVQVLDQVLAYEVFDIQVVEPNDTEEIRAVAGEDLLTLITCTPLGINTHRILVTAERVTPVPALLQEHAGELPDVPGFPWWLVIFGGGITLAGVWVWRTGYAPPKSTGAVKVSS